MREKIGRLKTFSEALSLAAFDVVVIAAIFHLSVHFRTSVLPLIYSGFPADLPFRNVWSILLLFVVWFFFLYYEGLYTKRYSFWDEVKALWKVTFFATVSIFAIVSLRKLSAEVSRTTIILMGAFAIVILPTSRIIFKKMLRRFGLLKRRVLILGAGKTGRLILNALREEPNFGYEVIGFLDDDPAKVGERIDGIKVHRGVERAASYLRRCQVMDVFIAMPGAGKDKLQRLINDLQHQTERVLFVPDMFGIAVLGTELHHFFREQAFAFELRNNLARPLNAVIKRIFDLLVCGVFLPLLAVPMVIMAALIRFDSPGAAVFAQRRIGQKGETFQCLKFRTMQVDSDEKLEHLLNNDPGAREEWKKCWKLREDPRVTRVGRFLRATSLDELPQILNVLKGEMSLVGPRPYLPDEDQYLDGHRHTILLTKPGITGLWQVSGRSNTSYEYRIGLDAWYVKNWNLWLDIVILLKTVGVVIRREGAW